MFSRYFLSFLVYSSALASSQSLGQYIYKDLYLKEPWLAKCPTEQPLPVQIYVNNSMQCGRVRHFDVHLFHVLTTNLLNFFSNVWWWCLASSNFIESQLKFVKGSRNFFHISSSLPSLSRSVLLLVKKIWSWISPPCQKMCHTLWSDVESLRFWVKISALSLQSD